MSESHVSASSRLFDLNGETKGVNSAIIVPDVRRPKPSLAGLFGRDQEQPVGIELRGGRESAICLKLA
jgi:hypothetical protein